MMVSSLQFIVMDMTVANVTAWLDENWGTSPAEVDEAFDLIQSYLYSTLKSQEGKAKAQRLLTQLRQMSKR
jgi:vacuolar-type H+-ATPase subunit D/Vma8